MPLYRSLLLMAIAVKAAGLAATQGLEGDMQNVLVDRDGAVLIVTINRMEKYNAIDSQMREELARAFQHVASQNDIRAVVLWGGSKGFVGGADVVELAARRPLDAFAATSRAVDIWAVVAHCRVPTIAALAGPVFGGGNELAMACDLRIASENALFSQAEVNIGLIPGRGGTQRLPRMVGLGKAKEMVLTGEPIRAVEALKIGLINKVVPPDQLLESAMELARTVASKAPTAIRMAKLLMDGGADASLEAALMMEQLAFSLLFSGDELKEGAQAFLDKRAPSYSLHRS